MAPLAANTRQQSHSVGEIYHMRPCCLGPGFERKVKALWPNARTLQRGGVGMMMMMMMMMVVVVVMMMMSSPLQA